jgi:hypothetical protein
LISQVHLVRNGGVSYVRITDRGRFEAISALLAIVGIGIEAICDIEKRLMPKRVQRTPLTAVDNGSQWHAAGEAGH